MVFGWGKKKEEKPEYRPRETEPIAFSDIPKTVQGLLELRKSQAIAGVQSCRDKAVPLLGALSHIGRQLEKDDLKIDEADRHIRVIVERGKKQVVDIIKKDISDLPEVRTYDDAVLLSNMLGQMLKKIGDALGRQTRIIHIFAKKYATNLKEILADIKAINEEAQRLLKNFAYSRSESDEIGRTISEILALRKFNSGAEQRISNLEDERASCQKKMDSCTQSIREIKSTAEYSKLVELVDSVKMLDQKKTQLAGRVLDRFTKISRPLGRYEHASSLDKDQKALLSGLLRSPFDVLAGQNHDAVIVILENVKKGVRSGSISVKDQEKSVSQITDLEESLDGLASEIKDLLDQQEAAKNTIEELTPAKLDELEKSIAKLENARSLAESKSRSRKDDVNANKSKEPQLISDIESRLRRFSNTRYAIT